MKRQITFLRLISESFRFAMQAISTNRLRTLLSLLGITVGIFAIISVYSVTDSMERTIKTSIESLGDKTLYIMKWPWEFNQDYPWWKYLKRPVPSIEEYETVKKKMRGTEAVSFMLRTETSAETDDRSVDNSQLMAVSEDYDRIAVLKIASGRYFSSGEIHSGANVAVIGTDIATNLFKDEDPLGKTLKVMGQKVRVIGVFRREGQSKLGNPTDKLVMISLDFALGFMDSRSEAYQPAILIKAAKEVGLEQLKDEVTGIMRAARKLKPRVVDDFAINEASLLTQNFEGLFRILHMASWFIGGFSILVGGFGIANIMFVSVRERTPIIGIQKALGAKRYFILLQFLFESVILSLIGGLFGLILVFLGTAFVTYSFDMDILLTSERILYGIVVSAVIGLIAGIFPAWAASAKDPVEAIRSTT